MSGSDLADFIAEKVFGYKKSSEHSFLLTWEGVGKGMEHANKHGYDVELTTYYMGGNKAIITKGLDSWKRFGIKITIFLAFWIAYMRALGVLE